MAPIPGNYTKLNKHMSKQLTKELFLSGARFKKAVSGSSVEYKAVDSTVNNNYRLEWAFVNSAHYAYNGSVTHIDEIGFVAGVAIAGNYVETECVFSEYVVVSETEVIYV